MVIPNHEHDDGAAHMGRAVVAVPHVAGPLRNPPTLIP